MSLSLPANGIVLPPDRPWASPPYSFKKKPRQLAIMWRPSCTECTYPFRNEYLLINSYPVTHIHKIMVSFHGTIVPPVDCALQTRFGTSIRPDRSQRQRSRENRCHETFGLLQFLLMALGLRKAVQASQRFIDSTTRDMDLVHVYVDDVLLTSSTVDGHIQHLTLLLQRLSNSRILVSRDNCGLGKRNWLPRPRDHLRWQ